MTRRRTRVVRHRVTIRGPLDLHRTAGFLFGHGPELRFTSRGLLAAVRAGGGVALAGVEPAADGVELTLTLGPGADESAALGCARQLAGLPRSALVADAHAAFARAARGDESLRPITKALRGLRLPQRPDPAACVSGAILAQQVTGTFAAELQRRVQEKWGESVKLAGETFRLPARAEVLAEVQPAELRPMQISQRKAEYIRDLCREIAEGRLDLHALAALPAEDATASLVARRGVGPTTAAWLLMFGAGHPDAWPPADVGLLRALQRLHGKRKGRAVDAAIERYRGARSLLAVHLWEGLRLGISAG